MERIAVTGSSGLIGSALVRACGTLGIGVLRLVRHDPVAPDEVRWDPDSRIQKDLDCVKEIASCTSVVNLAGESVAGGRWTEERKRRIRESRVAGTAKLARMLAATEDGPKLLISASAVGYYGDRGAEILTEESAAGAGFLAETCVEWEQAAEAARAAGIRVVHPRFGVVLAKEGGALKTMLPPFRMGLGAVMGSGEQYISWITLGDTVRALLQLIRSDKAGGAYNVGTPEAVTQREFARALADALGRPLLLKVPAFALRALAGELADEALLASARAVPERLLRAGFGFQQPEIRSALRSLLG